MFEEIAEKDLTTSPASGTKVAPPNAEPANADAAAPAPSKEPPKRPATKPAGEQASGTGLALKKRGRRNEQQGVVVGDKMHKSLKVQVTSRVRHRRYAKYVKRNSVLVAHDENNQAKVGDSVLVFETRSMSKTKRWKVAKILDHTS